MSKKLIAASLSVLVCLILSGRFSAASDKSGETLFKQHCTACHPNGSNIINPQKTLLKKDREKNKVMNADDIVKLMRDPGPGMSKFDAKAIPDKQAHEIAEYVIKTFK